MENMISNKEIESLGWEYFVLESSGGTEDWFRQAPYSVYKANNIFYVVVDGKDENGGYFYTAFVGNIPDKSFFISLIDNVVKAPPSKRL